MRIFIQSVGVSMAAPSVPHLADLRDFTCPMCLEVYESPCRIPCGHSFCSRCLDPLSTQPSSTCPVCRRSFTANDRVPDSRLVSGLRSGITACEGCSKQFYIYQIRAHAAICTRLAALEARRVNQSRASRRADAPVAPNRQTFCCPYCQTANLDQSSLVNHCLEQHRSSRQPVVCPICVSMPWGDPNLTSANFISHLSARHKFEYDTYVDYEQDDDAMFRAAVIASLQQ